MELVVDRLCLSKATVCRFPAVAFRLLDFPTLVIHHVDLELAEMLRSKITADPYYKLPVKFSEFQDREGNFVVQKGKSCLFKASPNTLQMHLANAPLYVMIMDTYPCTPKLVGSCSVPLNVVMDELYDEICQQGVSIPLAKGEKGCFEIFTLMGIKLGSIDFSYRLLSLGGALLRHIPDHTIAQVTSQDDQTIQQTSEQFWKPTTAPQILPSTQEHGNQKSETGVLHAADKNLKNSNIQTDDTRVDSVGVQTMKRQTRSRYKQFSPALDSTDADDIIITGVVCPPPLYYNSEADMGAAVSLYRKQQAWMQLHNQVDEDDASDDGTIRQEDKFSDIDELEFKQQSTALSHRPQKKTQLQKSVPKFSPQKAFLGQRAISSQVAQFPILQALMAELLRLHEAPVSSTSTSSVIRTKDPGYQDIRRNRFEVGPQTERPSPSRHERVDHGFKKTRVIVSTNKVMESKEKRAFDKVNQSELVPGLTHTQRLRLAKCNPKLLKELEAKEKERVTKWKQQRAQGKQMRNLLDAGRVVEKSVLESGDRNMAQGLEMDNGLNQYHSYRRPIPTPRSTLLMANKRADSEKVNPDGIYDEGLTKVGATVISGFTTKDLDAARALGYANLQLESTMKDHTKNSRLPGFGETLIIHKGNGKMHFSDDQVQVDAKLEGKEPQLQRIVEKDSDAEDREERNTLLGNEPQLQKVVDSYSYDFDKSTETSLDAGFRLCESPNLKKIIDHYSDDESDDYNPGIEAVPAAANSKSTLSKGLKSGSSGYSIKPNAAKSPLLPIPGTRNPLDAMRRPIFESGETTPSSEMQVLHEAGQSQENLSTSRRTPRTKGKLSLELSELLSSASVGLETFSDALETMSEEDSGEMKYLETKDIKMAADSKLGYTWT